MVRKKSKKSRRKKSGVVAGDLKTPIVAPKTDLLAAGLLGSLELENAVQAQTTAVTKAKLDKLGMLAELHDVDGSESGGWMLALKLAEEYIPGFEVVDVAPRRGRRQKWSTSERAFLLRQVATYCARENAKPHRACKELTKRGQPYQAYSHDTLYRQYTAAKKALVDDAEK